MAYPGADDQMAELQAQQKFVEKVCPRCNGIRREQEFPATPANDYLDKIYTPLKPIENEIRLLKISPSFEEEPLRCSLQPVSLDDNAHYTALSYCWGDAYDRADITVNGQHISVTRNLENALKRMRNADQNTVVWADAICINQQDATEKSVQVQMMGDIYANATDVWIWLGETKDNSDAAMNYIRTIQTVNFDDPNYAPDEIIWKAIRLLWNRPWFGRLWVVQEALLARKATFNCGLQRVDFDCFVFLKEVSMKYRRVPEPRLRPMQYNLSSPFSLALWDWSRLKGLQAQGGIPLFQLITTTGKAQCCLPVDKVYGLLSVSQEFDRRMVKVDYRICIRCLLIWVAGYMLLRREAISPLTVLQTHQQKDKSQFLPSWVPDYSMDDIEGHLMLPASDGCRPFSAGANNAAWTALGLPLLNSLGLDGRANGDDSLNSLKICYEDARTLDTLVIPGVIVDMIRAVHPTPWVDFYPGDDLKEDARVKALRKEAIIAACKEWECSVLNDLPSEFNPYQVSCGRSQAFWRTLITDCSGTYPPKRPAAGDFEGRFEAWMGRGERINEEAYIRPYSDAAITSCLYRSFATTQKGYLALVPRKATTGQLVCVLRGGNVPFVLNRRRDEYFELVGEAYVHGIMDGEIVRGAGEEDLKEFRIR